MHKLHPQVVRLSKGSETSLLKICYIYRDIRDVAESSKNKWGHKGERLVKSLDKAVNTYYEIIKLQNVFIQRYEDVFDNIPRALDEIINFLNIPVEEKVFNKIVNENSIQSVKKQTESLKLALLKKIDLFYRSLIPVRLRKALRPLYNIIGIKGGQVFDKKTQFHPDHISKNVGKVGSWRFDLSNLEKKLIEERYKNWLVEREYPCGK
jgi:hypothetical protein